MGAPLGPLQGPQKVSLCVMVSRKAWRDEFRVFSLERALNPEREAPHWYMTHVYAQLPRLGGSPNVIRGPPE